jgi:hypothetical protein
MSGVEWSGAEGGDGDGLRRGGIKGSGGGGIKVRDRTHSAVGFLRYRALRSRF